MSCLRSDSCFVHHSSCYYYLDSYSVHFQIVLIGRVQMKMVDFEFDSIQIESLDCKSSDENSYMGLNKDYGIDFDMDLGTDFDKDSGIDFDRVFGIDFYTE